VKESAGDSAVNDSAVDTVGLSEPLLLVLLNCQPQRRVTLFEITKYLQVILVICLRQKNYDLPRQGSVGAQASVTIVNTRSVNKTS
jgi:hypothetical protein